jgi:hypothetical protein
MLGHFNPAELRDDHGKWTDAAGAAVHRGDQVFVKSGQHKGSGARITGERADGHLLAQGSAGEPMVLHPSQIEATQKVKPHGSVRKVQ